MKIGCVNVYDTSNPRVWNGRLAAMVGALQAHSSKIYHLGPLHHRLPFLPMILTKKLFYKFVQKKRWFYRRDHRILKDYARQLQRKLAELPLDVIVSLVSTGSQPVAYLETKTPIVIWTDSTFVNAMNLYPEFARNRLCAETIRDGLANEKAALERATKLLYLSDWAAQQAINTYGIDPAKVGVVPVGPSFDPGVDAATVAQLIEGRPRDRCRLLFVGLEWQRKGGDIAFEVARRLNAAGVRTELTVVGCRPALSSPLPAWLRVTGVIDKTAPGGLDHLRRLFGESHFLILPTRADSFGIVFGEASAFGVPSLATRVGGVPTAICDGLNGKLFDRDADPDEYCSYVAACFEDDARYRSLAATSYAEYEARLNWDVIARQLGGHLHAAA